MGYGYDLGDNLIRVVNGASTTTNVYDVGNQLQTATTMNGPTQTQKYTYGYDPNGNRTQRTDMNNAVTNYAWDQANRLKGVGATTTYSYNGDGLRMSKTVSGTAEQFAWDVAEGLPVILTDGSDSYVNGPYGFPLEKISGGTQYFYHQDQLGNTRALTGSGGAVVQSYTYDAYGNILSSTGSVSNPFRFAGQYTDTESSLVYLRNRYYDSASGQFISRDPIVAQTRQAYQYAVDSPLTYRDLTGLWAVNDPDAPCPDNCGRLKSIINQLANGVRSKGNDIQRNPKGLTESGVKHKQDLWREYQTGLKRKLQELKDAGCDMEGVDPEAEALADVPVPVPDVAPAPDPEPQTHKSYQQTPDPSTGAKLAGVLIVLWWIGKLASPACGPALPACAIAF